MRSATLHRAMDGPPSHPFAQKYEQATYGIRDSEDQQTIWVPKVQHVDGISIPAKCQKDEVVRIPSAVQYHVKQVVIQNLTKP